MASKNVALVLPLAIGLLGIAAFAVLRRTPASTAPITFSAAKESTPRELQSPISSSNEGNAEDSYRKGLDEMNRHNYAEAIKAYDLAIRYRPAWDEALFSRGVARMSLQDYGAAEADFSLSIQHRANLMQAHFNRGIVRIALKHSPEAIADFDAAIHLKSDWTEAYYNRGMAKAMAGQLQGAREDYSKVLDLAPLDSPYRAAATRQRDALSHKE